MAFAYLADVYYEQGNLEMAIRNYRKAIAREAEFFEAYNNMGRVLKDAGEVQEAIHCYHQCLSLRSVHPEILSNLGNVYMERNMMSAATQCYKASLAVSTGLSTPFNNLGIIYMQQRNYAQAISCFNELLRINPMSTDGLVKRGNTYIGISRVDEAIQDYTKAIAIRSTMEDVHALLASAYMTSRKHAQYYSLIAARYSLSPFIHPPPLPIKGGGRNGRLRVGYVSSDYRNHSVSHLMGSVFGMHDGENVEYISLVFCYALRPNGGTEWGIRIQSEAEHFIDVSSLTFDATARMINEDQIQILIDLNGYAKGTRIEIVAMKPAPIQVSYMGFPGTTGAMYIDYLLTDEFVSPMKYAHIYSEKLVHLPHCYFVNDYKQKYCDLLNSNCQPKRCDYGLPEDKFIFACFNQLYKMDPEIFITWGDEAPRTAHANAAAQALQPDQIIFTDVVMKQEHIRRSSLANVCSLAGLPMITLPLEKMATRVSGSLCLATGLGDEMIVSSMKEYEEKAVSLGLNRSKLQDLTNRLKAARMSCPLFDTTRWVRNLERSYFMMWRLYCSGQHPQPFKVTENDSEFPFNQ
ncbi:hypothetical protein R3W88_007626 [Solanum pinnatisectum]|uniref:protein O-GlcNAc transferase n=1 Tax=Solanum pinnatisectum TaxID=50273 RepID=A0AAV9M8P1_9SOLN|nr:hypothetical protein R3W88_007626 [Solanum pinnatisectum]